MYGCRSIDTDSGNLQWDQIFSFQSTAAVVLIDCFQHIEPDFNRRLIKIEESYNYGLFINVLFFVCLCVSWVFTCEKNIVSSVYWIRQTRTRAGRKKQQYKVGKRKKKLSNWILLFCLSGKPNFSSSLCVNKYKIICLQCYRYDK